MGWLGPTPWGSLHPSWGVTITMLEQRGYGWPSVNKCFDSWSTPQVPGGTSLTSCPDLRVSAPRLIGCVFGASQGDCRGTKATASQDGLASETWPRSFRPSTRSTSLGLMPAGYLLPCGGFAAYNCSSSSRGSGLLRLHYTFQVPCAGSESMAVVCQVFSGYRACAKHLWVISWQQLLEERVLLLFSPP